MPKFFKLAAVSVISAIILLLGFTPAYATEGEPSLNIISCITEPVSCGLYLITYVIVMIGSLLVSLGAMIATWALNFSGNIVGSPAVSAGFKISLSIANLGFVAAIIVIAIATILRNQTYGIKSILWKLIVAALLVNFSLVIAGTILDFADGFSKFFIDKASPGGISGFINKLTNAFAPQDLLRAPNPNSPFWQRLPVVGDLVNLLTGNWETYFANILNMVFVIIFMFLIAFSFVALGVLLLIRYVYLGVLLILMPFAWLLWIFPGFQSNWSKWWHNFLRWTFFAPIALFFLYLATFTAINRQSEIAGVVNTSLDTIDQAGSPAYSLATLTKNPDILQGVGEKIIVLALAFGGLFAANSLSIHGAKAAYGAATGAVNGALGWARTKGGGAAARYTTQPPTRPTPPTATGVKGMFQKAVHGVKMGAYGVRKATHVTAKTVTPKAVFTDIKRFGETAKKSPGLFNNVYGGFKSGSGIFKARTEKAESGLNRLYTKKAALQGELDLLQRAAPGALNPTQQQRLNNLPGLITDVDTKIDDLEQQLKP